MKDCIKKAAWSVMFSMVLAGCGHQQEDVSKEEKLSVYNAVLDEFIMDDHYRACAGNEMTEKIHQDYVNGAIDELTYLSMADSLKEAVRKGDPKCVLTYSEEIGIIYKSNKISDALKVSMRESLKDKFFTDHFRGVSIGSVLDTVSVTARLDVEDFAVSYLEVVPYEEKNKPFGNGIGVIGFSKIYFNETRDKAILYYEFICGVKCASGEVVFIEKVHDQWKVKGQKQVWIS